MTLLFDGQQEGKRCKGVRSQRVVAAVAEREECVRCDDAAAESPDMRDPRGAGKSEIASHASFGDAGYDDVGVRPRVPRIVRLYDVPVNRIGFESQRSSRDSVPSRIDPFVQANAPVTVEVVTRSYSVAGRQRFIAAEASLSWVGRRRRGNRAV
jgi:hypothetical protein